MDLAAIASALIAARIGQAQLAVAARLAREPEMHSASVFKLVVAAHQTAETLSAAVRTGIGQIVDRLA